MLPNFLVIGAQRSGTTLLYTMLTAHPEVFVPQWRKEIHYFDRYYDRGVAWYAGFFPESQASHFRAIGELTPDYLSVPEVPARIHALLPECRLVVLLRNPVKRAFSGYLHHRRSFNERRSFEAFLEDHPEAVERGFYHRQLMRYLEFFPRTALLVLVYEELIRDPEPVLEQLRAFLGLSRGWPDPGAMLTQKINAVRSIPRFPTAFYLARRFGKRLRGYGLDRLVETAKQLGVPALFGHHAAESAISPEACARLAALYREDVRALEELLQRDLGVWPEIIV